VQLVRWTVENKAHRFGKQGLGTDRPRGMDLAREPLRKDA